MLLSIFSNSAKAKYRPVELYEMIIKAEKIVYGTISELDSTSLTLKIDGSLTNDSGILKVERFEDWTCASRWTQYKVGQRVFMFLSTWKGKLITMSAGNEGELPIVDKSVFIHGFTIPIPPPPPTKGVELSNDFLYFNVGHHDVYGDKYYGIECELKEFIRNVSFIRKCFDFEYGLYRTHTNWKIKCESKEIEQMSIQSKIIKWVYEKLRKTRGNKS